MIAAPLRGDGYAVVTASDGEEALKRLDQEAFDLVLLDVIMPGVNGFQLCRNLRRDPRCALVFTRGGRWSATARGRAEFMDDDRWVTRWCLATAMHAINAIPAVLAAEPGLYDLASIAPFVRRGDT